MSGGNLIFFYFLFVVNNTFQVNSFFFLQKLDFTQGFGGRGELVIIQNQIRYFSLGVGFEDEKTGKEHRLFFFVSHPTRYSHQARTVQKATNTSVEKRNAINENWSGFQWHVKEEVKEQGQKGRGRGRGREVQGLKSAN